MKALTSENKPLWIVALALTGTLLFLAIVPEPRQDNALPLPDVLPDRIGVYHGVDWLYCQNEQCLSSFRVDLLAENQTNCPTCGGTLDRMAYGEKTLLPRGTTVVKKGYEAAGEPFVFVSLVISGTERRGIHKPQVCLKGQGHTIQAQYTLDIPTQADNGPLRVTVLDLVAPIPGGTEESSEMIHNVYAYWFESVERKTPYHIARLGWMAFENVVEGVRRRWAYVAIATLRDPTSDEHEERLKSFINELSDFLDTHKATHTSSNHTPNS